LGEARTLFNLAGYHSGVGEFRRALDYADRSLALVSAVGNRSREATVLHWIGEIHNSLGEPQRALDFHLQSLGLSREIHDFNEEAKALDSLMLLYGDLGGREKASAYAEMLLAHYRGAQRELAAGMRYNVGLTHNRFGEW
jgi:tetratricopeptide (TPR) repeat protein